MLDNTNNSHDQLEHFHPSMLHNILVALRRFEPDFYAHLCRAYNIDADRIVGLFSEFEHLAGGQLLPILRDLREHQAYHDIVFLAGRNTLHDWCAHEGINTDRRTGGSPRLVSLIKQLLPAFLGNSKFTLLVKGQTHFVEVRQSIFTRNAEPGRPLCGFYSGYLEEMGNLCSTANSHAAEVRCCAVETDYQACLFQVSLG